MKATEFLSEAPLTDYVPVDFDKPQGQFKPVDKRLIQHPVTMKKVEKVFARIPYDVRLFFINKAGLRSQRETGARSAEDIRKILGKDAEQILKNSEDTITILFIGNYGADKVMMTPWIMAHRFGHAIQAGTRYNTNNDTNAWLAAEQHFFRGINKLLKDFYGIEKNNIFSTKINWNLQKEYTALFNAIGTQRSSRTGQIKRPYEFLYELFAQYLITGSVKLNPLPKKKDYGRKAWGRSTKSLNMKPGSEEESKYTTEILAHDLEILFNDALSNSVGKIFVM
jgi:hypothetical protein